MFSLIIVFGACWPGMSWDGIFVIRLGIMQVALCRGSIVARIVRYEGMLAAAARLARGSAT